MRTFLPGGRLGVGLFVALFSLSAATLSAQSLFEAFGGVSTPDIQITVQDRSMVLAVRRQGIFYDTDGTPALTFLVDEALNLKYEYQRARRTLRFYDADGDLIYQINRFYGGTVRQNCVKRAERRVCAFEIALRSLPLVLLDEIAQVDISVELR